MGEKIDNTKNIAMITMCVTLTGCGIYLTHSFVDAAREIKSAATSINSVAIDNKALLYNVLTNVRNAFEKFSKIAGSNDEISEMTKKGYTIAGGIKVINEIVNNMKIIVNGYDKVDPPEEDASEETKKAYEEYEKKIKNFNGIINMLNDFSGDLKNMKTMTLGELESNKENISIYKKFLLYVTEAVKAIEEFANGKSSLEYNSLMTGGRLCMTKDEKNNNKIERSKLGKWLGKLRGQ